MQRELSIGQIKELLKQADAARFEELAESLKDDTRKGVIQALETRCRQLQRKQAEAERIEGLYEFDRSFSGIVVGLDEVGRGAISGPLSVGAVVLDPNARVPLLNDSKQLTPEQRQVTAQAIKESCFAWTVCSVPPAEVDENGMALSLRKAFSGALQQIEEAGIHPDVVLIDGNPLGIDPRETNVIKGDAKSASIAAASIVAKVARDDYMVSIDRLYPQYGFASHKGYGSADHIKAIEQYGLSEVHRKSFCRSFNQPTLF